MAMDKESLESLESLESHESHVGWQYVKELFLGQR